MSPQTAIDNAEPRLTFLGITTPISGLTIPDLGGKPVVAILSTRNGTVVADMASSAQVRGSGSNFLAMSGTTAQISASLATVAYSSTVAGMDQLSVAVFAPNGPLIAMAVMPLVVVSPFGRPALTSGPVSFDSGTLTLEAQLLDGPDVALDEPSGSRNATSIVLINSTVGAASHLAIHNENPVGGVMPRLAIAGRVELDGETTLDGNGAAVSLARGSTLFNKGSMVAAGATRFTGSGTLVNDGLLLIVGSPDSSIPVRIDTALAGAGTVALTGATLRLGSSLAPSETISFQGGANFLHLAQPGLFAGSIAGFSAGDTLVLDGATASDALYTPAGDGGVLTVMNGALAVAKIRVGAPEAGTAFHLRTDAAGDATISLTAAPSGTADVFRFFDAAHGTQLLTEDAAERDTILSTRADLRYEGVGFRAIDPAHATPDTVEVYRFLDIGNGTHFMTSSPSERNIVLASRPDFVFEPSSTMVERATAQAGDCAVFRFFNNANGAHFYTADAGERASILAARPDMTFEGIAFYAPAA